MTCPLFTPIVTPLLDQVWGAGSHKVGGVELIFRCRISQGNGTIAFFFVIPIIWTIVQSTNISWAILGPFILITLGVIMLVKALYLKDDVEEQELGV